MSSWTWLAIYDDGTAVAEQVVEAFGRVDLSRCVALQLVPHRAGLASTTVKVNPKSGQEPIFFRRHAIELNAAGDEVRRGMATVIGWRRGETASYAYFFEDGRILLSDDFGAV